MNTVSALRYYSREDVQQALLSFGRQREVAGVFRSGSYHRRPSVLVYPADIMEQVRGGVIEFHCSLEHWSSPMALRPENYAQLRTGWDFIVDIDCEDTDIGKVAAHVFIDALQAHGVSAFWIKFTGGTGFHIGVPFSVFPGTINFKPTASLFPELARSLGLYLRGYCRDMLEERLLKTFSPEQLAEKSGKKLGDILTTTGIDPFAAADIDTVLLSPRHLFRMPYSLHPSGRVSLPIQPGRLGDFAPDQAQPENIMVDLRLLSFPVEEQAERLVAEALKAVKLRPAAVERQITAYTKKIPAELFPPCIKNILAGLQDGKKRSLFILVNFLQKMNWSEEEIEKALMDWNSKNVPPLRESLLRSQIAWQRRKKILPPNCPAQLNPNAGEKGSTGWYESFGVCTPDQTCATITNPASYPIRLLAGRLRRPPRAHRQHPDPAAGRKAKNAQTI